MLVRLGVVAAVVLAADPAAADEPPPPDRAPVLASPDADALEARFQQALDHFAARRFADAAQAFDDVAAASADPTRQLVARELAAQARARIVAAPPTLPPPLVDTADPPPPPEMPAPAARVRDGRYALLGGVALLGLGLYGPTLPILADAGGKTGVGLYMPGAGGSFFVGYMATRDASVTWGMTDAWWHGATRGALHGLAAYATIVGRETSGRGIAGTVLLGSLLEGTGLAYWASETAASPGLTNAIGKGADFGAGFAIGTAYLIHPESSSGRGLAGAALLGTGVGYGLGYAYAKRRDLTWGDGEVLRGAGLLGAALGGLALVAADVDNSRAAAGTVMAGGLAGLVIGDRLLAGRDFSPGQGVIMELAPLAGGLVGGGLAYLLSPEGSAGEERVMAIGAGLGALGGFALAYYGLEATVRKPDNGRPATTVQLAPQLGPEQRGLALLGSF